MAPMEIFHQNNLSGLSLSAASDFYSKQQLSESISIATHPVGYTAIQSSKILKQRKKQKDLRAHMMPIPSSAIIRKNMSCSDMRQAMRTSGLQ